MCGKTPKNPPKRAKRKEIEGQAILTSELLTMENQKKHKGKKQKLNPQEIKDKHQKKRKGEKETDQKLYRNNNKIKNKK